MRRKERYYRVTDSFEHWFERIRIMEKVSSKNVNDAYIDAKYLIVERKIDNILNRLRPRNEERSLRRLTALIVERERLEKEKFEKE